MKAFVIDQVQSRRDALVDALSQANCEVETNTLEWPSWGELVAKKDLSPFSVVLLHEANLKDRLSLKDADVPVIVYSGGALSIPASALAKKNVIAFPLPIDHQRNEQQRRYVEYLVGAIAGRDRRHIDSRLFNRDTRSFPYLYATIVLARAATLLLQGDRSAEDSVTAALDPASDEWWSPVRGENGSAEELRNEIVALTERAKRQGALAPDRLAQLHSLVTSRQWKEVPQIVGDLQQLLQQL